MESLNIHHVGYAVQDMEAACRAFETLGYTVGGAVRDLARKIRICFLRRGGYCVELVCPDGTPNAVESILKKSGAAPYHICYEVPDIQAAVSELTSVPQRDGRFILVQKPAPAPAIDDCLVAFLFNREIGLIELVEI